MQLLTSDVAINTRVTSLRVVRGINVGRNRMTYCCSIGGNVEVFGGVGKRVMFGPVAALRIATFIFLPVCAREKARESPNRFVRYLELRHFMFMVPCIIIYSMNFMFMVPCIIMYSMK